LVELQLKFFVKANVIITRAWLTGNSINSSTSDVMVVQSHLGHQPLIFEYRVHFGALFYGEGPRSRCYGRTAALRLILQHCDEDEEKVDQFFFIVQSNGASVE
jgi:hypothetical protein